MSALADRLRGVIRPASSPLGGTAPGAAVAPAASAAPSPVIERVDRDAVADLLGGEWHEAGSHRFMTVERCYRPGHRHGRVAIVDAAPPVEGWPRLPLLGGHGDGGLLFLDLETTGLAGGAGTYAFLVGCGWFDGGSFRIRQFFLTSHAAERALLGAVAALAGESGVVVTFNGKSFDIPLIDTRFALHRLATPFTDMPHVDMLHPARRLWRNTDDDAADSGCRLSALEQTLCGHEREGDVPGFEIPARYFHFVRSGDARPLEAVLEHNRLDLLSLALLTARAADLLDAGPAATRTAREALGIGRLYERGGLMADARAAFEHAANFARCDIATRADALRALAVACRRDRRHEQAADAWRRILDLRGCPPVIAREATEGLAVHHEHRLRDPQSARGFALQSLQLPASAARREALHHRLDRLNRKLTPPAPRLELF